MVQLYFYKRDFETQKIERWFSERGIALHRVDLTRTRMGKRELEAMQRQIGLPPLINAQSKAWKECAAHYTQDETTIMDALLEDPRRMQLPIVRQGTFFSLGYQPNEWATWGL